MFGAPPKRDSRNAGREREQATHERAALSAD
jgi:hypothetical protein